MMRRLGTWITFLLIAAGVPILAWSGISLVSRAVFFADHGVPHRATVLQFLYISGTPRGGYTRYYILDVAGAHQKAGFRVSLAEGSSVPVLISPRDRQEIVLGRDNDSWIQIFIYELGGGVLGYAVLLFYPVFFLILLPMAVHGFVQARRRGEVLKTFQTETERRARII